MSVEPVVPLPPWALRELRIREDFVLQVVREPELFHPFFRPCRNRVLLVVDGLDFSEDDFGLSTFVRTLLDMPGRYVRHEVTLAHLEPAPQQQPDTQMMPNEPRIARRLRSFRFDDPDHFGPDMYDVVMLLGIRTVFFGRQPSDRLADSELRVITEYMNGGGGLFATGDHGALGKALGHAVPRARNMRLWESTPAQNATDEVSMRGPRRNDTNRGGPYFDSQSDDVPQQIQPKMYVGGGFVFRGTYPHPLLCGPKGVIRVMPDHPHEGECIEPPDAGLSLPFGDGAEYPAATDGGQRPLPEVISTSTVPSGNNAIVPASAQGSASKDSTVAQTFGGICAYDGHRAGVGRVVTDATWHHFVNVNLVGVVGGTPPHDKGFLTPQGAPVLEQIRAYYRNLVVWTTRPERIRCMNLRLLWDVVVSDRVLEAVLTATSMPLERIRPSVLWHIGVHARDALGRVASQCQVLELVVDLVLARALPDLVPDVDPWRPRPEKERLRAKAQWVEGQGLADIALGGALVGLGAAFDQHLDKEAVGEVDDDELSRIVEEAGSTALRDAIRSLREELEEVRSWLPDVDGEKSSES